MPKEGLEKDVAHLKKHRQELSDLLEAYHALTIVLETALEHLNKPSRELDLLYRRRLVPAVACLTKVLHLEPDSGSGFTLTQHPIHYVPLPDLFSAGEFLKKTGLTSDDIRSRVHGAFSEIKTLIEDHHIGNGGLPASRDIQRLYDEVTQTTHAISSGSPVLTQAATPSITSERGVWYIAAVDGESSARLFKQGTLAGELIGFLGNPWGASRTKESLLDHIEETCGERPDAKQIQNAMREVNRKLTELHIPRMQLGEPGGTNYLLTFADTTK